MWQLKFIHICNLSDYIFYSSGIKLGMRTLRKFHFSDLALAYKVRGLMRAALIKFDLNHNEKFQEEQIKQAMIRILGENQNQVKYVVKNVFRYDRDNDQMVTYDQFTNFSVEQHFGEMAIQRLHRRGQYSQGSKRIMNMEEFIKTLDHCLSPISAQGHRSEYENLFSEIDLDKDGNISYEDYFIFLREYFGSQSQAYEKPQPVKPLAPVQPDFIDGNGQSPQERFAKLIYSQYKILVMVGDQNRNLILGVPQVEYILSNLLKISYGQISQIQDRLMNFEKNVRYEDFMRLSIVYYLTEYDLKKNGCSQQMDVEQYLAIIHRALHFVAVKPANHILRTCFEDGANGKRQISKNEYVTMMKRIFENYRFDTRGLPNQNQTNTHYSENYMTNAHYTSSPQRAYHV